MARRFPATVLALMAMIIAIQPCSNEGGATSTAQLSDQTGRDAGESPTSGTGKNFALSDSDWKEYSNQRYGFSIRHPKGWAVQPQDVSKLPPFTPKPIASFFFVNPNRAPGAQPGIEPPDIEVRLYQAGAADSLKNWLVSVGFANSGTLVTPYVKGKFKGLQVCQSTMIFPGCSVYALHKGFVYQLTPISQEGEAMMETFHLLS